jgi:hypothetical protein
MPTFLNFEPFLNGRCRIVMYIYYEFGWQDYNCVTPCSEVEIIDFQCNVHLSPSGLESKPGKTDKALDCLACSPILKMERVCSFKMSVTFHRAACCHVPEYSIL